MKKNHKLEIAKYMFPWNAFAEHVFVNTDTQELLVIKENLVGCLFAFTQLKHGGTRTQALGQTVLRLLKDDAIAPLKYLGEL